VDRGLGRQSNIDTHRKGKSIRIWSVEARFSCLGTLYSYYFAT